MARARSPDKRRAILGAAVHEIAETGTLFTCFANKKELLNELYFELKLDAYKIILYGEENSWQKPG
jgi:hypothetical protein